ncbi:hypothetical protein VPH35_045098 [Triticum aestivum]
MPKRRRHGELACCRERLYLVFDDWCHGYTIREVNLLPGKNHQTAVTGHASVRRFRKPFSRTVARRRSPKLSLPGENHRQTTVIGHAAVRRFPKPSFRMVARRWCPKFFMSAFGTRILAMQPRDPEGDLSERYFPTLDVRSRAAAISPAPEWLMGTIHYLPVGNKLFTLSGEALEMLCLDDMEWSWKELSKQPFNVLDVTSYSLHPEEQTFQVSTKKDVIEATFAFDTDKLSWKLLGSFFFAINYLAPFVGRGHFDLRLNGFVGLSKEPDTLGKIYGNVNAHTATLFYMGSHSKFCIVQCVSIENDAGRRYMYRLTTFSLRHDEHGEPMTGKIHEVQYYKVPKATTKSFLVEDLVAFWM